jgi:hypothetical protein
VLKEQFKNLSWEFLEMLKGLVNTNVISLRNAARVVIGDMSWI